MINTEAQWLGWLKELWAVRLTPDGKWGVIQRKDVDKPGTVPILVKFDREHEDVAKHCARAHNYWLTVHINNGEEPGEDASTTDDRTPES